MTRTEILEIAKPILFNTEMVRAILNNKKSVTRRLIKTKKYIPDNAEFGYTAFTPKDHISCRGIFYDENGDKRYGESFIKNSYKVGDILYVRETWCKLTDWDEQYPDDEEDMFVTYYRADYYDDMVEMAKWHPSIHMPKEAARIFLRVTDVRVERLQDMITDDYGTPINFTKEGWWNSCSYCPNTTIECRDFVSRHSSQCILIYEFGLYWNSTVKKSDLAKYGWDANPWVWVIEFERVEVEL